MSFSDINSIHLVGRLTRDAETKFTASGTACTKFSLAVNESRKVGEAYQDYTNFFDCVLWNREKITPQLVKGKRVTIVGKLHQDRWDKEGQTHSKVVIKIEEIDFQWDKDKGQAPQAEEPQGAGFKDDDIPF